MSYFQTNTATPSRATGCVTAVNFCDIPAAIMATQPDDPLTPRELHFAIRYANHGNAALAAREAGYRSTNSRYTGHELRHRVHVAAKINELRAAIIKEVQPTVQDVLRNLAAIVTADPNDLVEHRLTCCRHCWSFGLGYKRNKAEMRRARAEHERATIAAAKRDEEIEPFDEEGGDSYDPTEYPDPDCEMCFGEGVSQVVIKDTRTLSPEARALFAGIKQTRNGIEVLMHDKGKAVEMIAKHLGMLKEVVISKTDDLTDEQLDAEIAKLEGRARGSEFA